MKSLTDNNTAVAHARKWSIKAKHLHALIIIETVKIRKFYGRICISLTCHVHAGAQSHSRLLRFADRLACLQLYMSEHFKGRERFLRDLLHLAAKNITYPPQDTFSAQRIDE